MAAHAADEERRRVARDLVGDAEVDAEEEQPDGVGRHEGQQHEVERPDVPPLVIEREDEGEQVQREGEHPEEGHHRHIDGGLIRDGEQHPGAAGGEEEPEHHPAPARPGDGGRCGGVRGDLLPVRLAELQGAADAEQREDAVDHGPGDSLATKLE